jgi:GTP cyclohydrolase IA
MGSETPQRVQSRGNLCYLMSEEQAAAAIDAFLRALGQNPENDPNLKGTGARVAQAFAQEFLRGNNIDAALALRQECMAASTTEPAVVVRNIRVATMCPHHLLPAEGLAQIGFQPAQKLVGVGAIAELAANLAARLVLQETLTKDILRVLQAELEPEWLFCSLRLSHGCMTYRGPKAHGTQVDTWLGYGSVPAVYRAPFPVAQGVGQ